MDDNTELIVIDIIDTEYAIKIRHYKKFSLID